MKTRQLGNSQISVGEIGLGCWQFGGDFGPMGRDTARLILKTALEKGITFFDTADVYGNGRSEEFIGEFLKENHVPVTVATKFGRGADVYPDNYSEKTLRTSVEASLNRLGVNAIDLIQLHCIPEKFLRSGHVFDWLRKIQKEGLIRHFGASVESVDEALICLEQEGLLSLQVIFNIFRRKLISELFPKAKEKGVGIIVRLPLASGLLAGKFTLNTKFEASDHRNYNRNGEAFNVGETFAGIPFEKGVELVDRLKRYVPDTFTMAQMAQRWILDHEAVSVVITGASSPEQVTANAETSQLSSLPEELHDELKKFYLEQVQQHIRGPY